jgi:hypothetical protein
MVEARIDPDVVFLVAIYVSAVGKSIEEVIPLVFAVQSM